MSRHVFTACSEVAGAWRGRDIWGVRAGISRSEVQRAERQTGEPTLPVSAVARRLGVAPATLRTWDRRYGVGPSDHTDGRHRRYSPHDIARLEIMQRALLAGASTAEAAKYALEAMVTDPAVADIPVQPRRHGMPDEPPQASRLARSLSAAVLRLESHRVQLLLEEAIETAGPAVAWEEVVRPVLSAIGGGWRACHAGAESKHLLKTLMLAALHRATPVARRPRNHHPVLLADEPGERPDLTVHALAAELARRGIHPMTFGGGLPPEALVAVVRRTKPAVVVLCAQRSEIADATIFRRIARGRSRGRLFACGPGWQGLDLPRTVEPLTTLPSVVDRVSYVLLG